MKCGFCDMPRREACWQGEMNYVDGSVRICPNWEEKMKNEGPPLGARKSIDICAYLFQTLQLEAKRLTLIEKVLFERILIERYAVPTILATDLVACLRKK
jgi:hypothetical protein